MAVGLSTVRRNWRLVHLLGRCWSRQRARTRRAAESSGASVVRLHEETLIPVAADDWCSSFRRLRAIRKIYRERDPEDRQLMIDAYGRADFLKDTGDVISEDDWGRLWRVPMLGEEPLVMVEMVNSTPEPTGRYRTYFERVPPRMHTPLEALAWQAGLPPDVYARIEVQT